MTVSGAIREAPEKEAAESQTAHKGREDGADRIDGGTENVDEVTLPHDLVNKAAGSGGNEEQRNSDGSAEGGPFVYKRWIHDKLGISGSEDFVRNCFPLRGDGVRTNRNVIFSKGFDL